MEFIQTEVQKEKRLKKINITSGSSKSISRGLTYVQLNPMYMGARCEFINNILRNNLFIY